MPRIPRFASWGASIIVVLGTTTFAWPVEAQTTYHVSPNGADARDGKSSATAWRTLAKVNATAFAPGDQVLFERGGEWRECLVPRSSGTAASPIVFAAYGEGAKPRFWGSDLLDQGTIEPSEGGTFQVVVKGTVNAVLIGHRFLRGARLATRSDDPAANRSYLKTHPNTWYLDGGVLLLNTGGTDPRTDPRPCTVCVREDLVSSNQKDHLIFRDLVVDESAHFDSGYGFRIFGSQDVTLEGCEAYRCGKHHFGVIDTNGFVGRDLRAAYAMPDQGVGSASCYVSYSDRTRRGDTSRYLRCVSEHMEDAGTGGTYPAFVTHGEGIGSIEIADMVARGAEISLGNQESGATIRVKGGTLEDARLAIYGEKIVIDGTSIVGARAGVTLEGSGNVLQNARIVGCNPVNEGYQAAITEGGHDNVIRFCTIVMDPKAPDYDAIVSLKSPDSRLTWYGNIMISTGTVIRTWFRGFEPGQYHAFDNLYNRDPRFETRYDGQGTQDSLDDWKALGLDAGSLAGDPMFADPARGNYSLSPGSPAIDAMKPDQRLLKSIPTDGAGKPRLQGKAFDLGAYESPP